jgi:hypothetical protein
MIECPKGLSIKLGMAEIISIRMIFYFIMSDKFDTYQGVSVLTKYKIIEKR